MSALLDALIEAGCPAGDREHACLVRGLRAALAAGVGADGLLDALVQSLDADLSRQIDAVLHHPTFQALESAWRGVWLVVSRGELGQNVQCSVLNCSKEDLLADFEDSPEVPKSGLFKIIYSAEYGPFGGRPYAAMLANYAFGASERDVALLRLCSDAASRGVAPFVAAAAPSLLGRPDADALAQEGPARLQGKIEAAWRTFRESPPARFAALVLPRILGRAPYQAWGRDGFRHTETVHRPEDHLWQSGVFALGVCIVRSFALWRLAANITGPTAGAVDDLPTWSGPLGQWPHRVPVEVPLSEDCEDALAAAGVIPLCVDGTGRALFRRAPTCLAPSGTPASLAEADRDLHRQLPALFVITRFAHYLKVIHRECIGVWKGREALTREMSAVLDGYMHHEGGGEPPGEGAFHLRTRRPLRRAELRVEDPPPGGYNLPFTLRLEPNWSCAGRFFTLALDGTLDAE